MSTVLTEPIPSKGRAPERPLLESGDRYSRSEFERRYAARPDLKKAELIEGVVYVASPVRIHRHGVPHAIVVTWIGNYLLETPGLMFADNSTVRLDESNEPQPDVLLTIDPSLGGRGRIDNDDFFVGAPEFVMEIAGSSASYDLHDKKLAYERNGVREYVVVLTEEGRVCGFVLAEGRYVEQPLHDGVYRSWQFPGLWLASEPLLRNDLAGVIAELRRGLASPEHQAFATDLRGRTRL